MASTKHEHGTYELDAAGVAPGRLATKIVLYLTGKHKPTFVPYIDDGSRVVILNADKAVFTGKKIDQKIYRHHSMHPGGLKERTIKSVIKKDPKEVIRLAVMKMLPKNKLREDRMKRLLFK